MILSHEVAISVRSVSVDHMHSAVLEIGRSFLVVLKSVFQRTSCHLHLLLQISASEKPHRNSIKEEVIAVVYAVEKKLWTITMVPRIGELTG